MEGVLQGQVLVLSDDYWITFCKAILSHFGGIIYCLLNVRALAGDTVLCSWARRLTLTVPLSTQEYKWELQIVGEKPNKLRGNDLLWPSILSRGSRNTPSCFMLQKPDDFCIQLKANPKEEQQSANTCGLWTSKDTLHSLFPTLPRLISNSLKWRTFPS